MKGKRHFRRLHLVYRLSEINDESFLRQNPTAHKCFEVSNGPLHFEVVQVDFAETRRWKDFQRIRVCQQLNVMLQRRLIRFGWWRFSWKLTSLQNCCNSGGTTQQVWVLICKIVKSKFLSSKISKIVAKSMSAMPSCPILPAPRAARSFFHRYLKLSFDFALLSAQINFSLSVRSIGW